LIYEILLAPEAAADMKRLKANLRAEVRDTIKKHLSHEPWKTSRSRFKRLRGISHPQYRLRIGDLRVFYDISENVVEVLAIVPKSAASEWLDAWSREEK
jgi:mRNA-degrading endonuclease RelE of RelBE toxin-antitoxin system